MEVTLARPATPARAEPSRAEPRLQPNLARTLRAARPFILGTISLLLFIVLWHVLTTNRLDLYVRFGNLPTPEAVLARAIRAWNSPTFATNVYVSCRRILIGFLIAAATAIPAGLMIGRFALLRQIVFPVFEVIRPVPAIAWVPISIMLWPTNEESIVFITFLGSFFPILLNSLNGMVSVDPVLVRAARCLGAGERALFLEVYLPGAMPQIVTGLTVGMGVAWVSLIAAEMIAGQFGIGYFTWEAYSLVQYADIVLGMICIGILGLASSALVRMAGAILTPWRRGQ